MWRRFTCLLTLTFWKDKGSLKIPKLVNFGEFLKIWSLRSNIVIRQAILIGQTLGENAKIEKFKWDILSHFQTMWGSSKEYKKGQRDTFQDILGLASSKGKKSWATTSWNNGLFKQIILPTFITRRNSKAACRTQQMQFVFFQCLSHNFSIKFLVFSIFFSAFHISKNI